MKKLFTAYYIFILCAAASVIFLLGSFVAPTVFHTERILGVPFLSHYDAGLLMSQIFVKSNYILLIALLTIAFYDGMRIYKRRSNALMSSLAGVSILTLGAHIFFLTPKILEFQAAGEFATKSDSFATLHLLSEANFKLALFCIISLALMRLTSSLKDNCCGDESTEDVHK